MPENTNPQSNEQESIIFSASSWICHHVTIITLWIYNNLVIIQILCVFNNLILASHKFTTRGRITWKRKHKTPECGSSRCSVLAFGMLSKICSICINKVYAKQTSINFSKRDLYKWSRISTEYKMSRCALNHTFVPFCFSVQIVIWRLVTNFTFCWHLICF